MRRMLMLCVLAACAVAAPAQAPRQPAPPTDGGRAFTFEDMMQLKRLGEFSVSPDGKWVLFSVTDVNLAENTRKSHVWIVPLAGGPETQITKGNGESRPKWSPDGKQFLYVSDDQVFVSEIDGATGQPRPNPRQVTSISTGAGGPIWSPDGTNIVFTSEVWPDCHGNGDISDDACNKQRDAERAASKVKAMIFTGLFYRHWNAYNPGKRTHIFAVPAEGGAARDLTPGDHDAPPFSLGGQDDYSVSPDGKELAYASNVDEVPANSTNNEIFVVPIAGGTPKKISVSPGSDTTPLYSPDGKYIAWRMQERAGYEADRFRLVIYERATGKITNVSDNFGTNFDRWVGSFVWTDSSTIFFSAEDKGESPIYRAIIGRTLELAGMPGPVIDPEPLVAGHFDDLAVSSDGKTLVFSGMSAQTPTEIYSLPLGTFRFVPYPSREEAKKAAERANAQSAKPTQVTRLNASVLSQIHMSPLESFWFTGSENAKVQGFLVRPPNFDPQKKYPVKFLIHGGPQGAWGDSWSYRWNPELFAANGYVVIMINPRGSTGYGQKFIDDINGDWGGRVFQDLMLGLDYAEKTYPFIDKTRECALGASYGGYMAYWLEGHTTRFQCIVAHDGMFNSTSAFGTTEELWFNTWEFKGTPWSNPAMYKKWSPDQAAANFRTPILIVHGQMDYRLDVSEGFQAFTAMQLLKVPSKMLYFPDEGHWVLKPQNSRLWYKAVNDWVDQWTKPGAKR